MRVWRRQGLGATKWWPRAALGASSLLFWAMACGSTSSQPTGAAGASATGGKAGQSSVAGASANVAGVSSSSAGAGGAPTGAGGESGGAGDAAVALGGEAGNAGASSPNGGEAAGGVDAGGAGGGEAGGASGADAGGAGGERCDPAVVANPNVGHVTEAPGKGGCPAGMVPAADFCIDQFEASLIRIIGESSWSPYVNPGNQGMRAVSVASAVPQAYIDQQQAASACAAAGKRLCTDAEWLRACRGPSSFTYPYGNQRIANACNEHRDVHPAVEYFGTSETWVFSELDNACLNQLPNGLAPAGSFPACVTAEGAYDLMGNLNEWTAAVEGTYRGGYYVDTAANGSGCLYATTAHNGAYWDFGTGFRCCADP